MSKFLTFLSIFISFNTLAALKMEHHVDMSVNTLKIESKKLLVVSLKNDDGWHTYWKNPGDAGLEVKFSFNVAGQEIQPIHYNWPQPKRYIEAGDILAFGYSATNHFYFEFSDKQVSLIKNNKITIKGKWLVCKDICIPGERKLDLEIKSSWTGKNQMFKVSSAELKKGLNKIPKETKAPSNFSLFLSKGIEENKLALIYTITNYDINNIPTKSNILTPYLTIPLGFKHEKLYWDSKEKILYGKMLIDWDGEYEEPEYPLPTNGQFNKPINIKFQLVTNKNETAKIITIPFTNYDTNSIKPILNKLEKIGIFDISKSKKLNGDSMNLFLYIIFAIVGGLILNLMPCVLPVISLKLFGLIKHKDDAPRKILKHNIAYTLGVLTSFAVLAIAVISLKVSGENIGWGFQLQSPIFVFAMMLLIFVMSLNMFGLFEFMTPGGRKLAGTQVKEGFYGDFLNGVLATILSTPCSAPFLGTALTFAFTTSNINLFIILLSVGVGLSLPFVVTGIFPQLISFLPKPGAWMEKLKYFLGFTLLLTFVWLYDVFSHLVDFSYIGIYINTIFSAIFFAFFIRKKVTKKFVLNFLFFTIPIILIFVVFKNKGFEVYNHTSSVSKNNNSQTWIKWSEEEMQKQAQAKNWVFIDFTAKWCLTCKVNKKLVIETDSFNEVVNDNKITLLIADWTKRDDYITDFLKKYDIVGVPAYFLQTPEGKVIHLGETITIGEIRDKLK